MYAKHTFGTNTLFSYKPGNFTSFPTNLTLFKSDVGNHNYTNVVNSFY